MTNHCEGPNSVDKAGSDSLLGAESYFEALFLVRNDPTWLQVFSVLTVLTKSILQLSELGHLRLPTILGQLGCYWIDIGLIR